MKTTGATILVTGGGSGIGRELAQRFHALGNVVIVAGRRLEALEETIAGRDGMHAIALDVSDPASIEQGAKDVVARFPALNVLVNNAGLMPWDNAAIPRDLAPAEAAIITNLLGPIRLINALIGHLANTPDAAILNVTSGLAFVPLAGAPTYSATKFGLRAYTIALREQLRGKVEVIEIAPPAVRTDLTPGQSTREGYMPLDEYAAETMQLLQQQPTPPEILVENVKPLRYAEREGRFDAMVAALSQLAH
jgi:uncharacterized oxidoreductase